MTARAIESWRNRAANEDLGVDVERVAVLLLEAAARAKLLPDNSRDVFEAERHVAPNVLNEIKKILGALLEAPSAA